MGLLKKDVIASRLSRMMIHMILWWMDGEHDVTVTRKQITAVLIENSAPKSNIYVGILL